MDSVVEMFYVLLAVVKNNVFRSLPHSRQATEFINIHWLRRYLGIPGTVLPILPSVSEPKMTNVSLRELVKNTYDGITEGGRQYHLIFESNF
jgi:hypothetical protein